MDAVDGVEITSLVVSIATLIVLANLLLAVSTAQSTYTSTFLPRWNDRILGEWARFARRRFRWFEMRFETEFEVPFIFLSPANNSRGPLPGCDIIYIDGTIESCVRTRVRLPSKYNSPEKVIKTRVGLKEPELEFGIKGGVEWQSSQRDNRRYKDAVPVVANERVTWVPLLEALQEMERDSTGWEASVWRRPELIEITSLVAGIQIGRRVLESTSVIKKPYATTNMSSIIALAAILGLYWKQFDRDQDIYRAEGNSFVLRGSRIPHFGLAFSFEKTGRPEFNKRRLIPTSAVHELCFGRVPTIYRDWYAYSPTSDIAFESSKSQGQRFIKTLRLGSNKDFMETLIELGCNQRTAVRTPRKWEADSQVPIPLPFQIMAMLGQVLYVKNRGFTYLPNPTTTPWPKSLIYLRPMLPALEQQLKAISTDLKHVPRNLELLDGIVGRLEQELEPRDELFSPRETGLLYDSLTRLDEILMKEDSQVVLDIVCQHIQEWVEPSSMCDVVPPEDTSHEFVRYSFEVVRKESIELGPRSYVPSESLKRSRWIFHKSKTNQDRSFDSRDSGVDPMYDTTHRNVVWCTLFTRMLCWLLLHNFDENDVQVAKSDLIGSKEEVHIL